MSMTAQEFEALLPAGEQLLSDEPEMESSLHYEQLALLVSCLEWHWQERDDFFIGANLTVYYSRGQLRHRKFRGPDLFLVKDTERRPRNSWVVWEEGGRYPDLIIELLSDSTAKVDRTTKKRLYQDHFRTPEYFWFHPKTGELAGFRLDNGVYRPILGDDRDWRFSEQLGLYLGQHQGQLRYFDRDGTLIVTPAEAAEQERARALKEEAQTLKEKAKAQEERAKAQREQARAERLAAKLRALGVDPDEPDGFE